MKTAHIISLKYAPGLNKEFVLLGENIRRNRFDVKYLVSSSYKTLGWEQVGTKYVSTSSDTKSMITDTLKAAFNGNFRRIFREDPPSFVCFYNTHPINPLIAKQIKRDFPGAVTSLYLHDPYKPDKSNYGVYKAAYIRLVEFIQRSTVKHMDHVISPSEYSSQLFVNRYSVFKGKNHIAPLLVPDQRISENKKRRFFSIVGGAHPATGHDTFVELINNVAAKGLDYEFAIISSSDISRFLEKLRPKAQGILKIVNKNIITDSEINEIVRKSYAVFRLDREVTQSGVVPVSYMNETPIIVREIPGLTQHVKHQENGYIVPFDCSAEGLLEAMDYVKNNFFELSKNARKSYEAIWAEWNWDKYYGWLVQLLRQN